MTTKELFHDYFKTTERLLRNIEDNAKSPLRLFEDSFKITVRFFKDITPSKRFQDQLKDEFTGDFKLTKLDLRVIQPLTNSRLP